MSSGLQMIDLEPGSGEGGAYWPTLLGITVSFWSSYSVCLILQQWLCTWRLPLFLSSMLNSFSVSGPPWNLTLVWDKILSQVSSLTQCLSKVIAGYLITEGLENFVMPTECSNAEPVDSHTNGTQMTSEGSCLIPKVSLTAFFSEPISLLPELNWL